MEAEICGFQPDLISYFSWSETSGGAFSRDLMGSFVSGHCLLSGFFQGGHVVFKCG